jgi:hypothetical protein
MDIAKHAMLKRSAVMSTSRVIVAITESSNQNRLSQQKLFHFQPNSRRRTHDK